MSQKNPEYKIDHSIKQNLYQTIIKKFPSAYAYFQVVYNQKNEPKDFVFIEVNNAFETLVDLSRNDLINQKVSSVLKGVKDYEFDWMTSLKELVLSGQKTEFERYSNHLKKWLAISLDVFEDNFIVIIVTDVTEAKNRKRALDTLLVMFDEFQRSNTQEVDYHAIADGFLELSDAKFAVINLYEQDGQRFRTMALVGDSELVKKATQFVGYELNKKVWAHDPVRASKIHDQTVTRFSTLSELIGNVLPKRMGPILAKTFSIGESVVIKIQRNNRMLGDITLFMPKHHQFIMSEMIEIFTNQFGMMIERKQIEEIIQLSEKRFKELIISIDAGIVVHGVDGSIIDCNEKACKLLGHDNEKILGKFTHDLMWKFVNEEGTLIGVDEYPISVILKHKTNLTNQIFGILHEDNTQITWVNVYGTPIFNEKGEFIEAVISFTDYTEIKTSRDRILASEEQYRLITTQMQLGQALHEVICDEAGHPIDYRFISVNKSFERLTGLKSEDILGKTVLEVLPNTERTWIEKFGKVALFGNTIQFEEYSKELNRYYNVSAYSPKKGQFAVLIDDVTEQKTNEIELSQNYDDLKRTQEIAKIGTWRRNFIDNKLFWSEQLFDIYGLDSSQGVPDFDVFTKVFTPEGREALRMARTKAREQGVPYELELEVINNHQHRWVWIRGDIEKDEDGNITGLNGAVQDITERKLSELQVQQKNLDLKESQRIAKLGTWVRDITTDEANWSEELYLIYGLDPNHAPPSGDVVSDFFISGSKEILLNAIDVVRTTGTPYELELEIMTKDGVKKWVWVRSEAVQNQEGEITHLRGAVLDITERKLLENRLFYLSYHDHLTGLHNRRYYEENLAKFDTQDNLPMSIIIFDVNGLKVVNDSFGHMSGDKLLVKSANAIKKHCRKEDVVARIGGDEFIAVMPKTNAIECSKVANLIKETAYIEMVENIHLSISYGYGTKVAHDQDINEVIANAENYMYRHKLYERSSTRSHTIDLILNALFEKSYREAEHSDRVSYICKEIAKKMNLSKDKIDQVGIAGLIHDIGKIGVDERVLNKEGGLTVEERKDMERHPEIGWRILSSANEFANLSLFVLHHHEKWDGTGYPSGLQGNEIELEARIISVADAYDAMTSERSYRKGMSKKKAIDELKRCAGTQFDPEIVDVFVNEVLTMQDFESNFKLNQQSKT